MRKSIPALLRTSTLFVLALLFLSGCNYKPVKVESLSSPTQDPNVTPVSISTEAATPVEPAHVLTICMGQEPASLFVYGDASQSARAIRQAIYDGPIDIRNYDYSAVILESIPTLANGQVTFQPVTVQPGGQIVDSSGNLATLAEGVSYLPAGCGDFSCAVSYTGGQPAQMEQQVVALKLSPGLTWSDGSPLKADDSQYSYEVARSLYPRARPDLFLRTQAYQALDEVTVEWRGVPGYRFAGYVASFFFPLPRHAWGALSPQDLLTAEQSTRKPLGWGPYVVDEWTPGDHISLSRNPSYFRASEGLPRFERLVFRFVDGPEQALAALLAGECDYLDESTRLDPQDAAVVEASAAGKLSLFQQAGSAWEHLDFGILSLNSALPAVFSSREVRQAVASCTDRQRIVSEVLAGQAALAESYIPPEHPLFNAELRRYPFDPNAGKALLETAGWVDADGDPATPRRSSGVAGIADDTPLELSLATTDESEKQRIGALLQESLAQCGIKLKLESLPAETLYASGPQGVIFGRNFSLAQFAWMRSLEPPCFLYTTQEIPGTYPQYPKGWGGANVSGYSNLDFDRTCWRALSTLPEQPEHKAAHQLAQAIFMEDLPALPLYFHSQIFAARPELCGIIQDASADTPLWNLEHFDYGGACPK